MESTRQQKVGRNILKELSGIFIKEGKDLYGSNVMVSVTVVRMSADLGVAKIYLSIFPNDKNKTVLESLNNAKPKIRYALGQATKRQMRVTPELIFYHDDSVDYYEKIDNLMKDLDIKPIDSSAEKKNVE